MAMSNRERSSKRSLNRMLLELTEHEKRDLKTAFDMLDNEGSGIIRRQDLKVVFRALGFYPKNDEISTMINDVNRDGSGTISFKEFLIIMANKITSTSSDEELKKMFSLFDFDKTKQISLNNLRYVRNVLGKDVSDEELKEMITAVDANKDGLVTEEEFFCLMKSTGIELLK
ncbi:uncharacterized protein [Centruroides vittatus]|uniref:uncharacterized protein n=1 Tax=Centruroides vittatus TaxID=120091 RepID=UPI0035107F79